RSQDRHRHARRRFDRARGLHSPAADHRPTTADGSTCHGESMMMSFQERAGVLRHAAGARAALAAAGFMVASTMLAGELPAQHDYYNTDAGRPLNTEDAVAIEYRGFELQAAPIRLERGSGGRYQ